MTKAEVIRQADLVIDETYKDEYVSIAKMLSSARNRSSLLSGKTELLAAYKLKNDCFQVEQTDSHGNPYMVDAVEITAKELVALAHVTKSGSFYKRLFDVGMELSVKNYIYKDDVDNHFKITSIYNFVEYKDGKLTIGYNPAVEKMFFFPTSKFSKVMLGIAFKLRTNGGFQLYKFLQPYVYKLEIDPQKDQSEQPAIRQAISISELRMALGYIDLDKDKEIQQEAMKAHPDAKVLKKYDKKPKYKKWGDLNCYVLQPGIQEINEMSDIYIAAAEPTKGAHGKVESVEFRIQKNLKYFLKDQGSGESENDISEEMTVTNSNNPVDEDSLVDELIDMFATYGVARLPLKQIRALIQAASYDISKCKKALNVLDAYPKKVEDIFNFLKRAVEEDWEPSVKRKAKPEKSTDPFKQYEQRDYDYDALEKKLVAN